MLSAKGQNLIIMTLIVILLTMLAALNLLKRSSVTVFAQEERNKPKDYQALQATRNQIPNDVKVANEGEITPQSDNSGIEVVPIAAFRNNGDSGNGWVNSFNGGYIQNASANSVCFMAPIYPPTGATLTQFRFSLIDDSATEDLFVWLDRVRLTTGAVDTIAGGSVLNRDSSVAFEASDSTLTAGTTVVSHDYAYYVDLCFAPNTGTEISFYGARLFYQPTN